MTDGVGEAAREEDTGAKTAGVAERDGGWLGELTARCKPQAAGIGGATNSTPGGGATKSPPGGGGESNLLPGAPACGETAPATDRAVAPRRLLPLATGSTGEDVKRPGTMALPLPPPPGPIRRWYSLHRSSSTRCLCCAISKCWCMPPTASRSHSISCQVSLCTAISQPGTSPSVGSCRRAEQAQIFS